MDRAVTPQCEALFLTGQRGRLFALLLAPAGDCRGQLLCIPPFTEESNRSRVMLTTAARALAQQGFATLILDPYGTGDSEGDFEQALWSGWQDDVAVGIQWLKARGPAPILWGLRSGALLAASVAARDSLGCSRLLFWQPVLNGKQMLTQYLRLRVGNLSAGQSTPTTTKALRQRLADGETLEIGGYYISPQLADELDGALMPDPWPDGAAVTVDWLEAVDPGKTELSIGSAKLVERWRGQGVAVNTTPFSGPAFWQLHERFLAQELIDKTREALSDGP